MDFTKEKKILCSSSVTEKFWKPVVSSGIKKVSVLWLIMELICKWFFQPLTATCFIWAFAVPDKNIYWSHIETWLRKANFHYRNCETVNSEVHMMSVFAMFGEKTFYHICRIMYIYVFMWIHEMGMGETFAI